MEFTWQHIRLFSYCIGLLVLIALSLWINIYLDFKDKNFSIRKSICFINSDGIDYDYRIYDNDTEKSSWIKFPVIKSTKDLGPYFSDCLLCVEDQHFHNYYESFASSIYGMLNSRGGSVLRMQLAKNAYFPNTKFKYRTLSKKLAELYLGFPGFDGFMDEDDVLLAYINNVPIVQHFGLHTTAQAYFNKSIDKLSLGEIATLLAMNKYGKGLDDKDFLLKINKTRKKILRQFINNENLFSQKLDINEIRAAIESDVVFRRPTQFTTEQKTYDQYVVQEARTILKNSGRLADVSGCTIFTSYSSTAQICFANAINDVLQEIIDSNSEYSGLQVAEVTLKNNGQVISLIGDSNPFYYKGMRNRAFINDKNTAGSIMKPFVYAVLFEKEKFNSKSELFNGNMPGGWNPDNYDGSCPNSKVSAQIALKHSINKCIAYIFNRRLVTPKQIKSRLQKCDMLIQENIDELKGTIGLGSNIAIPFEVAGAYIPFRNLGVYFKPYSVTKIVTKTGDTIRYGLGQKGTRVYKSSAIKELNTCLREVVTSDGTGYRATSEAVHYGARKLPSGGKTGTTQNNTDAWFVGFTDKTLSVIWVGFPDNRPIPKPYNTGGMLPARIYGRFLAYYTKAVM